MYRQIYYVPEAVDIKGGQVDDNIDVKFAVYKTVCIIMWILFFTLVGIPLVIALAFLKSYLEDHWRLDEYCTECHRRAINVESNFPGANLRAPRHEEEYQCPNGHVWVMLEINPY